jgi:hypothetical protein
MTLVTTEPALRTDSKSAARIVRQPAAVEGRKRVIEAPTNRVRRDGKFFRLGDEKFYVKGVTYGPFAPAADGSHFATRAQTRKDFEQVLEMGANCVRVYYVPPDWFLELAREMTSRCSSTSAGRRTWRSSTTRRWPSRPGRPSGTAPGGAATTRPCSRSRS